MLSPFNNNASTILITSFSRKCKWLTVSILTGNPLKCDCSLLRFIRLVEGNRLLKIDTVLCLQSDHRNSSQTSSNCPDSCSCKCAEYGKDSYMFVNCSSKNLSAVPQFWKSNSIQTKVSITFMSKYFCSKTLLYFW